MVVGHDTNFWLNWTKSRNLAYKSRNRLVTPSSECQKTNRTGPGLLCYLDVSTTTGPVKRRSAEFRLTFDMRLAFNEQLDQRQVSLFGCQVQRRPAIIVIRVHTTLSIDQHLRRVQMTVYYSRVQSSRSIDISLIDRGAVVDKKSYDFGVSGRRGHLQRCALVVATDAVNVSAVAQ